MKNLPREKKQATVAFSAIAMLTLVLFIALMLSAAKAPIVVVMLLSWLLLVPFGLYLGYSMQEMEKAALDLIRPSVGVMALMIAVGGMVSIWLCAGTVPSMIYWGLKIISPSVFLLVAFIVTSLVGMATGTSWGTVATVGVAMMGVGLGLGLPSGLVAGAIISGSYFGNGLSPVSDVPLMTSSVTNVDLWEHVKYLSHTSGIAWVLSAVLYGFLGIHYAGTAIDMAGINDITSTLDALFHISVVTLIPMAVVLVMMFKKFSALWSILTGSVVGMLVSVFYQGFTLAEVFGFVNKGFSMECDNAIIASLLNRGGFASMYELVAIIVGSMGVGGILKGTGMLDVLIIALSRKVNNIRSLSIVTAIATLACTTLIGTYYFCMTFVGTLMPSLYQKAGYRPENAGRIINDLSSHFVIFLPWNAGGMYMMAQLGVPIREYAPFVFFNIIVMVLDVIFGVLGIGARKYTPEEMERFAGEAAGQDAAV